MSKKIEYTVSGGNVFEDLGLPDAKEHLFKSQIVAKIGRILWEKGLTQAQAAALMGIDQPKVSALLRGRFRGYSVERLFRFLNALGHDVTVTIGEKTRAPSETVLEARVD